MKKSVLVGMALVLGLVGIQSVSAYVSQTTASVSIAPRDNLIIATTIVNWDTRASDTLAVDWIAPKGGFCKNSEFVLSRGMNTSNDVSWAYRTVIHPLANGQTIVCSGKWTANVVNVANRQVLASAGYVVSPVSSSATVPVSSVPVSSS